MNERSNTPIELNADVSVSLDLAHPDERDELDAGFGEGFSSPFFPVHDDQGSCNFQPHLSENVGRLYDGTTRGSYVLDDENLKFVGIDDPKVTESKEAVVHSE